MDFKDKHKKYHKKLKKYCSDDILNFIKKILIQDTLDHMLWIILLFI